MGWITKIFNPKELGSSIISGIDKSFLSKEESIDYFQKMLVLYEPYKLAQRVLAFMFSGVFLLIHGLTAIAHLIFKILEVVSNIGKEVYVSINTDSLIDVYSFNNETLGTIVLIIISFYFAGGVLEGTVKRFIKDKK